MRLEEWVDQNGRKPIVIDEQSGELLGEHRYDLAGECDTILHAFSPLGYKSWNKIPLQDRETLIEQLKDNFMLDTRRPSVKRYLNYRMSKGYINFKHEMLMHFRNYATIEEARGNPFGNISPASWSSLCDRFAMESVERIKRRRDCHLRGDRIKPYIEKMKRNFRQHAFNVVPDPAVAPTNEDPEVV
ncbi:hypothetical protein MKX03_037372 [Papaver bracteatum]|nr:hypothetical protein MKX03_037372 [Papaver bracteatum]